MILEHALIDVKPGQEDDFEEAYGRAHPILLGTPGCASVRMHRGVEHPSRFLLLVEWDELESHTVGFRQSERFTQWRSIIGPFFDGPPEVDHVRPLGE